MDIVDWHGIRVGDALPELVDEIGYDRVVMSSATTWDYTPLHFDPEYARAHGHPTILIDTMHFAGFVDRLSTEWAGPYSRVVRRKVALVGSIYAGDSMIGRGRVSGKHCDTTSSTDSEQKYFVDLQIEVSNQHGELCCPAELTVQLLQPDG